MKVLQVYTLFWKQSMAICEGFLLLGLVRASYHDLTKRAKLMSFVVYEQI